MRLYDECFEGVKRILDEHPVKKLDFKAFYGVNSLLTITMENPVPAYIRRQ